jgi:hypothetical protein
MQEGEAMTEYVFHWWPSAETHASGDRVSLRATSDFHGAALALRYFAARGCDITDPFAHIDMTGPDGARRTLLVDEVLNWLQAPEHAEFIKREALAALLH